MTELRANMHGKPGEFARQLGIRRIFIPMLSFGVLFGFGIGMLIDSIGLLPWWGGAIITLIALVGFARFCYRQPSLVYSYFKGARGEEIIASELSRLPATWSVFNGVLLPGRRDIDHVVVGPQGVFVIETKFWKGNITFENGQILVNGRSFSRSPIEQVRQSVQLISEILPNVPTSAIHGFVCFASKQFEPGADVVKADDVTLCSHLKLCHALTSFPCSLDASHLPEIVARLNALTVAEDS